MPVDHEVVRYRTGEARSAIRELLRLASKPYEELSIDEKYSMRYNLIVLVEALASLCIHIAVEEYGKTPSSYREALRIVAERLAPRCSRELEALAGLRNLLVHRYWTVDDSALYESVKEDFGCVEELLGRVEEVYLA